MKKTRPRRTADKKSGIKPKDLGDMYASRKPQPPTARGSDQSRWWKQSDEGQLALSCIEAGNYVRRNTVGLTIANVAYARAYDDTEDWGGMASSPGPLLPYASQLTFNVVGSCVDGVRNKVFKEYPRIRAVTEKGNGPQQRQAAKLTQFLDGELDEAEAAYVGRLVGKDCCVYGMGHVLPWHDQDGELHLDRIYPDDVIVDPRDGRDMRPRQMWVVRPMDRDVCKQRYPGKEDTIDMSTLEAMGPYRGRSIADQVAVVEAWHLPSSATATDGLHVICCDGGVLFQEQWDFDWFPLVTLRYEDPLLGFVGVGIAKQLLGQQAHINKLLTMIDEAESKACMPRVFLPQDSGVIPEHLFNPGGVVFYEGGQPPIFNTAPGISGEVYNQLDREMQYPYKRTGLSELTAQSQKPPGLNAAVALREYHDIETERFSNLAQRWELFALTVAKRVIALTRKAVKEGKQITARTKGNGFIRTIDWDKVDLPAEKFNLELWPVSSLPRTPEARMEKVQEFVQAGWLDRQTAMQLLDMPDIDAATQRMNSTVDRCNDAIERMLDEGEYVPPDQFYAAGPDGQLSMAIFKAEVSLAHINKEPKERIALLVRWLNDAMALNGLPIVPPIPPPLGARPEQPPTSALIPNAPH